LGRVRGYGKGLGHIYAAVTCEISYVPFTTLVAVSTDRPPLPNSLCDGVGPNILGTELTRNIESRNPLGRGYFQEYPISYLKFQRSTYPIDVTLLVALGCSHPFLDDPNLLGGSLDRFSKVESNTFSYIAPRRGSSQCWNGRCCYKRTRLVPVIHPKPS